MTKKVTETKYGWYMENEKTKVELEDIVGLVQTDDSTNSVQLKKEAQLSICEKRLIELEKENEQLKEALKELKEIGDYQSKRINELSDENEQLRKDSTVLILANQDYRKENEQLKKDRFICLDCEHSGYVEIGCLCEYNDHWQEHITECEDFKGLRE